MSALHSVLKKSWNRIQENENLFRSKDFGASRLHVTAVVCCVVHAFLMYFVEPHSIYTGSEEALANDLGIKIAMSRLKVLFFFNQTPN